MPLDVDEVEALRLATIPSRLQEANKWQGLAM
jgi:hypothetical protein